MGSRDARLLSGWGGGVGSAENEKVGRVVAEWDAVTFKGQDDTASEFAENAVALVGTDADLDGVGDGTAFNLVDAQDDGVGDRDVFEGGVVANLSGEIREERDDLVRIGTGVDRNLEGSQGEVAGEIGDDGDLAVGNGVEGAIEVAKRGAAKGKVFDGAFEVGDDDDFAYVVLILNKDEDSIEHVLEEGLRAETDADAEDAGRGEQRLVGDVEEVENLQEGNEAEDAVGGGTQDGCHGAELRSAVEVADVAVGAGAEALDEEKYDALKNEDDEQDGEQAGEFVADKGNDVGVPSVRDDLGDMFVLRGLSQEEHDCGVSLS